MTNTTTHTTTDDYDGAPQDLYDAAEMAIYLIGQGAAEGGISWEMDLERLREYIGDTLAEIDAAKGQTSPTEGTA